MGTIGTVLSNASAAALGKDLWDKHLKTISGFWESVSRFFNSLPVGNLKVYQDGLVAAGEDGLKIINEGAGQGSINYQIIEGLLRRGAILIKTEDIALVRKEYGYIKKLTSSKSSREIETAASRYRLAQRKLLEDRDNFIAGTIESTLKESDTGVLFIGAYHEVLSKLQSDIRIVQIKEVTKVREYQRVITNMSVKTRVRYQQLIEYLVSPVLEGGTN